MQYTTFVPSKGKVTSWKNTFNTDFCDSNKNESNRKTESSQGTQ